MITEDTKRKILEQKSKFPVGKSAILPSLYAVQEQEGYVTAEGMEEVGKLLDVPLVDVEAAASFYTMLFKKTQGKYIIDVCVTLSCSLLGGGHLLEYLSDKLGIKEGETTPDGLFTIRGVECLGNCGNAPVAMINDRHYENLTEEKLDAIIEELRNA
jgi:NADH-quinone oxidoreductase E subunit